MVILDEPTAALSRQEINEFYGIVRRLKAQGKGIIFITHKFDEIFSLADRYIVLRDGASVGEGRIADADENSLVRLMVGRDLEHVYPAMPEASSTELLRVDNLSHPTEFENINFTLNKGEVLGFYGLVGAGRFGGDDGLVRPQGACSRAVQPGRQATAGAWPRRRDQRRHRLRGRKNGNGKGRS